MKIVIPGGSGQVGQILARAFRATGDDVVILGRGTPPAAGRFTTWDARTVGAWAAELDGADVVINLAGKTVDCRYNAKNRREIIDSRVDSTRVVGQAIARADNPPAVWLQASTATIYAHTFERPNDEATGVIGGDELDLPDTWKFSIDVVKRWEAALEEADTPATRKVALRSAMVMSPDRGGVYDVLLRLVRFRLGGRAASGRQYVSWVHDSDFTEAVRFLIANDSLEGPVNIATPDPLPYSDFMRDLRAAAGVRFGLPASRWMLEVGAFALRTETELVLKSRRVVPGRLLQAGFEFEQPDWSAAAVDLVSRHR
ncbi:TIGR01777 family protein [Thermoleophilia bacterium SCSIO 60948]|nr:TIGR01777 family protein [Thermoleophilia bacterium SCSIO 60948]